MSLRRRASSIDSFSGRRSRAGSMVQSIALNLPLLDLPLLQSDNNQDMLFKKRSKSTSTLHIPSSIQIGEDEGEGEHKYILHPLTSLEKHNIWSAELDKYENDYVIDLNDQELIEQVDFQEALEFKEYLQYNKKENDSFIVEANDIINDLNKILTIHNQVTLETSDFQSKSTELIGQLENVTKLYDELSSKLTLFESLDPIVATLNTSSSGSIVIRDNFNDSILKKLDNCMKFVNDPANAKFKEIDLYSFRFKQCMVRALSLIRNYICNGIKEIETSLQNHLTQDEKTTDSLSSTSKFITDAMVNSRFETDCSKYRELFLELYTRAIINHDNADEYFGLLNDVYSQYFKSRTNLLSNVIKPHIMAQSIKSNKSLTELAQSNISFFTKIMKKEHDIFRNIFYLHPNQVGDQVDNLPNINALNKFYENFLDPLYYLLRNRIIRENNIGELCELITIIQNYAQRDDNMDNVTLPLHQFDANSSFQDNQEYDKIDYEGLLRPIMEDSQTRLVFKVQTYVDKNIVSYKKTGKELTIGRRRNQSAGNPLDAELAVPNVGKLNEPSSDNDIQSIAGSIMSLDLEDLTANVQGLYVPVVKSIQLLSKIYQLLNQNVFDDLANSVVHLVILSMRDNFADASGIESKLYLIKNLIFFRNYIETFDIEHVTKETNLDFGGLRNLFSRFISGDRSKQTIDNTYQQTEVPTTGSNNYILNAFLGTIPKVVNDIVDSKYELQMALRNAVHAFIEESKTIFIQPLSKYPEQLKLDKTMQEFMNALKNELPRLRPRIEAYIDDKEIFHYLIDGIKEVVLKSYEEFYSKAITLEKSEQIEYLLDLDTMITLWADIVTEMLAGEIDEIEDRDALEVSDISDVEDTTVAAESTLRGPDDTSNNIAGNITENADVSKLILDASLLKH